MYNIKKTVTKVTVFFIVVKIPQGEPYDKKIISNLGNKYNIHHRLILLMKLNTQTYYNIRIVLGLIPNDSCK